MKHPAATYAAAFLEAAKDGKISSEATGRFFKILRRNGDLAKLPEILKNIESLYYKKEGITKVEVVSARVTTKDGVEKALRERFGAKLAVEFSLNPGIIGGIILKINDELVIDASVKRRLEKLFAK